MKKLFSSFKGKSNVRHGLCTLDVAGYHKVAKQ